MAIRIIVFGIGSHQWRAQTEFGNLPRTMRIETNKIIQGLWIGSELSVMEQLSISSFLLSGHDYHLYVYDDLKYIPAGTVVRDASEILPSSSIFQYKNRPSYAGFSNFFRYKLLLERGGWWADTDIICLKPFDFPDAYVFSSEINHRGSEVVNSGVIKAPPGSDVMAYAWKVCQGKNPARLVWGETGPKLMAKADKGLDWISTKRVTKLSARLIMKSGANCCSLVFELFDERTYAIHLWNEMWRLEGQDKNAQYSPTCLYEKLKRIYLPVSPHGTYQGTLASPAASSIVSC